MTEKDAKPIPEKPATMPLRSPRTWHGMTTGIWIKLLARNRLAISPTRIPMALAITGITSFNSVMRGVSELLRGGAARNAELAQPPLFVIGHWRTGTTLLHELLVLDKQFSFPTTYDCMAPHHFLLTGRLFPRWMDWLLPPSRPMDNMPVGFSRPQEDEFALVNLGIGSPYTQWAFPNRESEHEAFLTLDTLTDAERARWKQAFRWFLQRLTCCDSRRLVLKSPTHTARVATLREMFPQSLFVHIVRNPLVVIPSTVRMWKKMGDVMGLQVRRERDLESHLLEQFVRMYAAFERDRPSIPAGCFAEVRYEDLIARPLESVRRIYAELGLGDFSRVQPALESYVECTRDFKTNEYRVPDDQRSRIAAACGDYMRRYGYENP